MDYESYKKYNEIIEGEDSDYRISPQPKEGEDLRFFDIESEMGRLRPSALLNAFHRAKQHGVIAESPKLIGSQPYSVTFEDITAS